MVLEDWGSGLEQDALSQGYRFQYDTQGRMTGWIYLIWGKRYGYDAQGRLVAVRSDAQTKVTGGAWTELQLDSLVFDDKGRLSESVSCMEWIVGSLIHPSACSRRTYDYNISVSLRQAARARAVGQVRLQEGALVGIGQVGRRTTLHVLAPNGKSIARASGEGQAVLAREALPDGLVVWQMEVDGAAWGGGKVFLPRR